ncbi:MAG: hypothetical protein Q9166_006188 [cf. Caloplaca sp. 2 TL-2023]
MATEFIGSVVTVTLNQPRDSQVRGLVEGIAEGQRLDLRNVTWLSYGTHVASLCVETTNIKDLDIEPGAKPSAPPQTSSQRSPDPAILSFDRNVVKLAIGSPVKSPRHASPSQITATSEASKAWGKSRCPECPSKFVGTLQDRTSNIKRHLQYVHGQQSQVETLGGEPSRPTELRAVPGEKLVTPPETNPVEDVGASATLTAPFTELALNESIDDGAAPEEEQVPAAKPARKRTRKRPTKKGQRDEAEERATTITAKTHTPTRANGWGEPPFLQKASVGRKPHPLDAPIHRAEQRLARARRGRRNDLREEQNGWATEEVTDIQDMGDFDFEGNLSKFDKREVFEQIRQDDTTADEARLVNLNRLPSRPGTNGGRNLHYTENVLGSPQQNGRVGWIGESESEISDDKFSSGRVSRRNLSRASVRKPPSRKGSTMIPHDQTSSSGFPYRYSSQEHPSPHIRGPGSSSRYARSESSRPAPPMFQLVGSGGECPCVTPLQMLELEQLATSEIGLSDDMMTENAARSIAQMVLRVTTGKHAIILAGNTKTGARVIAAARHLRNHSIRVGLFVLGIEREGDLLGAARRQLNIYQNSGGQLLTLERLLAIGQDGRKTSPDVIIDAMLGMHLSFEDLGTTDQNAFFEVASWANSTEKNVVAIDVPSGMDAASGFTTGVESLPHSQWAKITHSEWASEDAFSASAGSGVSKSNISNAPFKRLPYNFCAISLQPFNRPVCSPEGTIFDITNILPWLKKHGTNPVTGAPLKSTDLIKLNFTNNDDGEMVDPVTFKVFTNNTHIVALKNTSNVFAYDTIERLNIKAKNWRDLVSEEEFSRKDIVTLQDPQNVESRNLSTFKYLQEGASTLTPEQQRERNDPSRNINTTALGNGTSLIKPSPQKQQLPDINPDALASNRASIAKTLSSLSSSKPSSKTSTTTISAPTNTTNSNQPRALHTTGLAAASLTSTGLTPHTTADLASLSLESYLLVPRRVRTKGYCLLTLHPLFPSPSSSSQPSSPTPLQITLELSPEFAPKACWNFVQLAKKGYYNDVLFHRNIPNFMIQGGDPTGTGKGGASCFAGGKNFDDELEGPLSMKFDRRGMLAMANKGKNSNGSQFFITYRACPHLVRKHTVFGMAVEESSFVTLKQLEQVEVDDKSRPKRDVKIKEIAVLVDPFEEFLRDKESKDALERDKEELRKKGGAEDDRVTWTGKRVRVEGIAETTSAAGGGVGKYIKAYGNGAGAGEDGAKGKVMEEWEGGPDVEERAKKKVKGGGFGNFDGW